MEQFVGFCGLSWSGRQSWAWKREEEQLERGRGAPQRRKTQDSSQRKERSRWAVLGPTPSEWLSMGDNFNSSYSSKIKWEAKLCQGIAKILCGDATMQDFLRTWFSWKNHALSLGYWHLPVRCPQQAREMPNAVSIMLFHQLLENLVLPPLFKKIKVTFIGGWVTSSDIDPFSD